jgi:lipoate-protein ligase A
MPTCRLLPTENASGYANMARDETLLRSALERGEASLRFYTWSEPTLSLGYFQSHAERQNNPLLTDVAWVRRPTGGDAILHHHEITYALALPAGSPWHNSESWICRMHHAIAAALATLGVASRLVVCGEEDRTGPLLCFRHQTPGDVLISGNKIVGSAQRRPHGAMMQHGSVLLQRSPFAPALPGIHELTGRDIVPGELTGAIVTELRRATGWQIESAEWTGDEKKTASRLEQEKYATAEWNLKR